MKQVNRENDSSNDGTSRSILHTTSNTLFNIIEQRDIYYHHKINRRDSDEVIIEKKKQEKYVVYWGLYENFFGNSKNITIKRIIYDYWDRERNDLTSTRNLLDRFISFKIFFTYECLNRTEFLIARELVLQLLSSSEEKRQKIVKKWPSWNLSNQEIEEEAKERLKKLSEKEFEVIEKDFFGKIIEKKSDKQTTKNFLTEENKNKKISIKKELKKLKKLLESLEKIKKCCEYLNNGLEKLINLIYLESGLDDKNREIIDSIKKFVKDFLTENIIERIEKEILPNIEEIKKCLENELVTNIISIESLIDQGCLLGNTNKFLEKLLEKITNNKIEKKQIEEKISEEFLNNSNENQDISSNDYWYKELIQSYKVCIDKRKINNSNYYETKTNKKALVLLFQCFTLFLNIDEREKKIEELKNNEEFVSALQETLTEFSNLKSLNSKFINYIDQRKYYFLFLEYYSNPPKQFKEKEKVHSNNDDNKKTINKKYLIIIMITGIIVGVSIIVYETIIKKYFLANKKRSNYKNCKNNKQKKLFF